MHGQKFKIFKWPKNREDGSDFDEIQTKKSQRRKLFDEKFSNDRNERKVPAKIRKMIEKFFEKFKK